MSGSSSGAVVLKLLSVTAALILGILAYLFLMQSRSVLYRYFEVGNPIKEPAFAIFNPFRDHQPERSAEHFLKRLKDGDCQSAMSGLADGLQYQQDTCEHEKTNTLTSWRLRNRTDEPQSVRMYYQVGRQKYLGLKGQVWVTVEKRGDRCQVTRYDRWY
jgi:hypothetical protein